MFDLKKFLTENKLTRNSVLLENDNAPSLTIKDMKSFDPRDVGYGGETDKNHNPIIIYKNHKYPLEYHDQEVEDWENDGSGYGSMWFKTPKIPDTYFKFLVGFEYEGDNNWGLTYIDSLDKVEVEPSWEIDPESDEIPDEEEFDFGDELDEKKITKAEKNKKEDIVKGLKKSGFKKDDPTMYAIATAKAKKLAEDLNEIAIATAFQFTPEQFELLKKYGVKQSTSGRELYFPPSIYDELNIDARKSKFKQDFSNTVKLGDQYIASQILTAIKKSLSSGNTVKIKDKTFYVLKGHLTKNNNFNFPNPFRNNKQIKEMKGPELVNTIKMIGGTLSKIEQLMDFGMEQSPETIKGLNNVLDTLIDIQSDLESDRRAYMGPASDYQLENIIKRK